MIRTTAIATKTSAGMSVLVAGNLAVDQLVEDDGNDGNCRPQPPVGTEPFPEALAHTATSSDDN
jgi:hypothetical protein